MLLLADEVICGFGRTGNMFGSQTFGLKPDLMTVAKGLSSGYQPISALMISDEIYQSMVSESDKIGIFGHGYTYGGHPVPAAVALETLRIYEDDDIVGRVRATAPRFKARLDALTEHPLVGQARSVGLLGAVELMKDKATRTGFEPADGIGPYCADRSQAHGVIHRAMGDSLAFSPPLIISERENRRDVSIGSPKRSTIRWRWSARTDCSTAKGSPARPGCRRFPPRPRPRRRRRG